MMQPCPRTLADYRRDLTIALDGLATESDHSTRGSLHTALRHIESAISLITDEIDAVEAEERRAA